jgi:hypothetical protein
VAYQITQWTGSIGEIIFAMRVFRDAELRGDGANWFIKAEAAAKHGGKSDRREYALFRRDCHVEVKDRVPILVED